MITNNSRFPAETSQKSAVEMVSGAYTYIQLTWLHLIAAHRTTRAIRSNTCDVRRKRRGKHREQGEPAINDC